MLPLLPQVKELCAMGFSDKSSCHEILRQSGGDLRVALVLLQRPLLEPFHKHIWSEKPEPPVEIHHPDKEVRRLGGSSEDHWTILLNLLATLHVKVMKIRL